MITAISSPNSCSNYFLTCNCEKASAKCSVNGVFFGSPGINLVDPFFLATF